jgi:hypothetical protein
VVILPQRSDFRHEADILELAKINADFESLRAQGLQRKLENTLADVRARDSDSARRLQDSSRCWPAFWAAPLKHYSLTGALPTKKLEETGSSAGAVAPQGSAL